MSLWHWLGSVLGLLLILLIVSMAIPVEVWYSLVEKRLENRELERRERERRGNQNNGKGNWKESGED